MVFLCQVKQAHKKGSKVMTTYFMGQSKYTKHVNFFDGTDWIEDPDLDMFPDAVKRYLVSMGWNGKGSMQESETDWYRMTVRIMQDEFGRTYYRVRTPNATNFMKIYI